MAIFEHRRQYQSMKKFYNWFYKYYSRIEKNIILMIEQIIKEKISTINDISSKTALEYACGSGSLTLEIAKIFKSVNAKDASTGMLERAKNRAKEVGLIINFNEGNILEPAELPKSYDYVFVSFALHLFSPEDEKRILKNFLSIARECVVIIDHGKKWQLLTAIVEWMEGSYYDKFIKIDFSSLAKEIGASNFEESEIADCNVMIFYP